MSSELFQAITYLEEEKGISKDTLLEALEAALISAYKKNFKEAGDVHVIFDEDKGTMKLYERKKVVEEIEDDSTEISLEDAQAIDLGYSMDDVVDIEITPKEFGR